VSAINSTLNEVILIKQDGDYWTNATIIADRGATSGWVNLTITAYDNVSLVNNTVNMTVGIDENPTSVTAITVGQWYANGSVATLNASITNGGAGVKNATVNVSAINSTLNEVILVKQDGDYWTNTTIIADRGDTSGLQNLTITAYDNVSNVNNTVNMTVGIDTMPPVVTAIEPIGSHVSNGSALELNVSVTDEHSGVNASAVWVNVSNINNTLGNFSLNRIGTSDYWNGSIIVNTTNEGTQNLTVYAYDNVSNCNSSVNLTAGRDFAPPSVTAVTVGQWYANNSVMTLNASITDELSGVKNATVNVSAINSTLNEVILIKQDGDYWTNATIIADRGNTAVLQNLTITAYDNVSLANNTVNMTVGIDENEPVVTAITVGVWTANNSVVTLNASITDSQAGVKNATVNVSAINSTLNEVILIKQDGDYWTNATIIADIPTTATKNLTITTYDSSGNCNSSVNLTLGVDSILPANGVNPTRLTGSKTWIKWAWTNPSIGAQPNDFDHTMIYINGNWVANVSNTTNYYNATGLEPGSTYEISIRTVDIVGNINTSWSNNTAVTVGEQPIGGIAVIIIPKINETTAGNSTNFTIRVRSTQSFQEAIELSITLSDIPAGERANLSSFNWTSDSFLLPANGYTDRTVRVDVPDGTSTGYKVFCAIARASLGTSKDYGAVNVTG
jgi:hypothetical protein